MIVPFKQAALLGEATQSFPLLLVERGVWRFSVGMAAASRPAKWPEVAKAGLSGEG
jgi:hypothetical protein